MQKRIQWTFLAVGGLILLLAGLYWLLMPRVISTTPFADQSEVLPSSTIEVEFSQPLAQVPGMEYLQIDPVVSGTYQVKGRFLSFTPSKEFTPDDTVRVTVNPKVKSQFGIPLYQSTTWSFQIKHPWLTYLLDTIGRVELYQIDPEGLDVARLLDTNLSVIDYSLSPNRDLILYSVESGKDSVIEYMDLSTRENKILYTCVNELCSQPLLSPDQKYVSFTSGSSPQFLNPEASQVLLLTLNQMEPVGSPITVSGTDHPTRDPAWSAKGWMVYYDETVKGYGFYQPSTGKREFIAHDTGEVGTWSPDGSKFVFPKIMYPESEIDTLATYSSQLVAYNPETGEELPITRNESAEDVQPVYSPDGLRIAFARKFLSASQWTPGRQLWIVRADGNNPSALTNSENNNHLGFTWSPDGKYIAYLRFNTASYNQSREVWIMDSRTGITQKILINGYRLGWIP